ncbi:MAG: ATP-binding cassette domain-containing protein, partial [Lysobacter sp.]
MPAWINTPAALQAHFEVKPARIGLDTEFIRERTYWPQLALVQIAIERDGEDEPTILLVDPLRPGMAEALAPILADTDILKVVHSPSEDLVAFKHACGIVPKPLFDTQQAAALAGIGGGLGYQKLVEQLTGVALAKGETRSDWMRRPLSPAQLEYAADAERVGVRMVMQELGLVTTLSVAENLLLDRLPNKSGWIRKAKLHELAARQLAKIGMQHIDPATPVARLGIGQQQMVEIARTLQDDTRVLALDEPTAMLTPRETSHLFEQIELLKARGVAIVYVSHRLEELQRIA